MSVAPQVNIPNQWVELCRHSAAATGGIHPPLGKRISAPQVDVPILGRVLQARPQEPPEVYSNLLPPSVGETTDTAPRGRKTVGKQPPKKEVGSLAYFLK